MKLPRGFVSSGVRAGLRKKRPDLALIVAEGGASAAAIFTKNRFQAAPVVLSKQALARSGGRVRAVVINAGCANAITGKAGMDAARRVREKTAEIVGCPQQEVFMASTGVIGVVLDDQKVRRTLPGALARLSSSGVEATSHAILTTDVGPKVAQASFTWDGKRCRLVGIAKGAGMIHPDMATMLAFLMTDAPATPAFLRKALTQAAESSFNAISVDGDTSTNDTVLLMASGKSGGEPMERIDEAGSFMTALEKVCRELAWMIVRDGEGATRVIDIEVTGAKSDAEAKKTAHAVGTSPLVKTAIHGGDPNWGRILAAIGRCGVAFSPKKISLRADKLVLVRDGAPAVYREKDAAKIFSRERVPIRIDLGVGSGSATLLSSDLGHDYIAINTDYRS
ncbi:MAG TPA: bifunctional glutamate N-acetyltransferase/amino-acid acetyltransferase ArgJ [Thermoanaerobaculia bacterium]|nr:bifunctional glutamate N-acetyltransferase/amino-acid acetyltransferase ArgJ [Thermoanaerobaculia bacterium]